MFFFFLKSMVKLQNKKSHTFTPHNTCNTTNGVIELKYVEEASKELSWSWNCDSHCLRRRYSSLCDSFKIWSGYLLKVRLELGLRLIWFKKIIKNNIVFIKLFFIFIYNLNQSKSHINWVLHQSARPGNNLYIKFSACYLFPVIVFLFNN